MLPLIPASEIDEMMRPHLEVAQLCVADAERECDELLAA